LIQFSFSSLIRFPTRATRSGALVAALLFPTAASVASSLAPPSLPPLPPARQQTTVCTITVNSPDEKEVFKRYLPEDRYRFVELVERGRPDWLGSACSAGVQCDVLVISGHFDAGTEFYTDRLDQRESLPVEEMERVACSGSCPGLFSQLKEVYLFGCNTLNAAVAESTTEEIMRTLVRSGHSRADAEALARRLDGRYAESNRDTMRRIFSNVPVIYGFSSLAPLGASAGPLLAKVLQSAPVDEFALGSGAPSAGLLKAFGPSSMIAVAGLADYEPRAAARPQICEFLADAASRDARPVDAVHRLIARDPAEARMLLDRIERVTQSLSSDARATQRVAVMQDRSAAERSAADRSPSERSAADRSPSERSAADRSPSDRSARDRWLAFARKTDRPDVRARMVKVASAIGWLAPAEERAELVRAIADQVELDQVTIADVDLACALNRDGSLDDGPGSGALPAGRLARASNAGVLACLGSNAARSRVLKALTSTDADDVHVAQVYLKHRPLTGDSELRDITRSITRMPSADAQVRALEALGHHRLSDAAALAELTQLFTSARSLPVQRAIAGVLIRADREALPRVDLPRLLRQHRIRSSDGADVIDVLIRRLSA
jgi:hypothetical protein